MTFPATCTLIGSFFDASGNAMTGNIQFIPSAELTDVSGGIILPQVPINAQVVNGTFSVHLLPTDTAGITQMNWSYLVTEQLLLQPNAPYTTRVQYYIQPTGTGTINLASLAQYTEPPTVVTYGELGGNNTWSGTNTFDGPSVFNGTASFTEEVTVPTPVNSSDAATKSYVDNHVASSAWLFDVTALAYGAKGDGQFVTDGAMSTGSAVLTSASGKFVSGDVGKAVQVKGAGPAGVTTLVTTVLSYQSATQVTLAASNASGAPVSGALVLWATDDTAHIQSAINAAVAYGKLHGSAIVYFPVSSGLFYGVAGALVTGGSTLGNSQLTLAAPIATTANKVSLTFQGVANGSALEHWQQLNPQLGGSTLVSFGVFANATVQANSINANGNACVIGGPAQPGGYGVAPGVFSNMLITFENFSILTTHSADGFTYGAADFSGIAEANVLNFAYGTTGSVAGGDFGSPVTFGTGASAGLLMPANGNNDNNYISNLSCHGGYTYALFATEHTVIGRLCVLYCWAGMVLVGAYFNSVGSVHGVNIEQASIEACPNLVYVWGGGSNGVGPYLFANISTEIGAPTFSASSSVALNAALGEVILTGLFTVSNISVQYPTGMKIVNGQQGYVASVISASTYTMTVLDDTILIDASSNNVDITLISAAWTPNTPTFVRLDSSGHTVTIHAAGSELINGSGTQTLVGQYSKLNLFPARVATVWGWYER